MSSSIISLYCCTHHEDIARTVRLCKSIYRYNKERISFYLSAPDQELPLFEKEISEILPDTIFIAETSIISLIPGVTTESIYSIRGGLRQQIIKSNFWRLGHSINYLCLDSDCIFLREFSAPDLIVENDTPYSVIHEGKTILQPTNFLSKKNHRNYFYADRKPIQKRIERPGVTYDYGYAPFIWSSKVWKSLEDNFLIPNKKSFLDIIVENGSEFTWYGEALMKYRAIEIYPREELFKHFHYLDQEVMERLIGSSVDHIRKDFLGIVLQSSWEKGSDRKNKKSFISRTIKRMKNFAITLRLKGLILWNIFIKW